MTRTLAILLVTLWATTAAAQAPDLATLEASGNKHYELAEYDAAIADFKEAFRISDEPGFLFNIAQSYRLGNNCREAATFYKTFLRRVPDAPNAEKVKGFITEMEACAATQPAEPTPTPTPTPTQTPTQARTPTPADTPAPAPRTWMKWTGVASLAVGAIASGLAVKFALDGKQANDDLQEQCKTSCTSVDALAIESDGKSANRNALIASVAGGAAIVTGIVFVVLSRSGGSPDRASVSVTATGASIGYGWRF